MKKGSHASPEALKRMQEAQLRAHADALSYITPEELEACRQDPTWEARHHIADRVVCRACAASVKSPLSGKSGHLRIHHRGMTVRDYRAAYPGARLFSFEKIAKTHGLDVDDQMAKFADEYIAPDQLSECRKDPKWEKHHNITDVVICRECGLKLHSAMCGGTYHLGRLHGLTRKDYVAKYPGAPWSTPARAAGQRRAYRTFLAKPDKKEKKRQAQRQWAKDHRESKTHDLRSRAKALTAEKRKAIATKASKEAAKKRTAKAKQKAK